MKKVFQVNSILLHLIHPIKATRFDTEPFRHVTKTHTTRPFGHLKRYNNTRKTYLLTKSFPSDEFNSGLDFVLYLKNDNYYTGKDRSKFLINCLFRVGGAAILLSNRQSDHKNSKYELLHTVHDNTSRSDRFYNSILREEDSAGIVGININRDLLAAAIATITPNLTTVGHLILPIQEKLLYITNYIAKKLFPALNIQPYIPNYSNAVDHFLPHVGGKPVLDDLQKTLRLSDDVMEPSRMTLYRYGNTSSSSVWYELAYVEAKGRVKEGNRVWQLAFGSGFKCSSVIWRAMKAVDHGDYNPWTDEIDGFPVNLVDCEPVPVDFAPSKYDNSSL